MKRPNMRNLLILSLTVGLLSTANLFAQTTENSIDIHSGHFSREGNNDSPAKASRNNIYIKLYPEKWIGILYIPYPYGKDVDSKSIDRVFDAAKEKSKPGSFTRNKFDVLQEAATIHLEEYELVEGQIQFECGSMNPCAIRLGDDYLEMVKSGIINEHIVKFDHITP